MTTETDLRPQAALALPKRYIEQHLISMYRPINLNVIRLLAVTDEGDGRAVWKEALHDWYQDLGDMVWKTTKKPLVASFYFDLLYKYPFGGFEESNVASFFSSIRRHGRRVHCTPAEVVPRLTEFHVAACDRLSTRDSCWPLISTL